jgi:hypothetical protein
LRVGQVDTRFRQKGGPLWQVGTGGMHESLPCGTGHVALSALSRESAHRTTCPGSGRCPACRVRARRNPVRRSPEGQRRTQAALFRQVADDAAIGLLGVDVDAAAGTANDASAKRTANVARAQLPASAANACVAPQSDARPGSPAHESTAAE